MEGCYCLLYCTDLLFAPTFRHILEFNACFVTVEHAFEGLTCKHKNLYACFCFDLGERLCTPIAVYWGYDKDVVRACPIGG